MSARGRTQDESGSRKKPQQLHGMTNTDAAHSAERRGGASSDTGECTRRGEQARSNASKPKSHSVLAGRFYRVLLLRLVEQRVKLRRRQHASVARQQLARQLGRAPRTAQTQQNSSEVGTGERRSATNAQQDATFPHRIAAKEETHSSKQTARARQWLIQSRLKQAQPSRPYASSRCSSTASTTRARCSR